jgi:hypothetical protein
MGNSSPDKYYTLLPKEESSRSEYSKKTDAERIGLAISDIILESNLPKCPLCNSDLKWLLEGGLGCKSCQFHGAIVNINPIVVRRIDSGNV